MKLIGKIFLVISFIISYVFLLVSVTAKFQLMDTNFWIGTFNESRVYEKVGPTLAKEAQKSFLEAGVNKAEAAVVSAFFSTTSLQSFTEKNIVLILDYVNARSNNLVVYFPVKQVPKDIRESLGLTSDQIEVKKLISTFGSQGSPFGDEIFIQLRTLGSYMTISFVVSLISLIIHLPMLYKLETPEKRLVTIGSSFVLSGILTLVLIVYANVQLGNVAKDLTLPGKEGGQIILGTLIPPLTLSISKLWAILSVVTIIIGVLIFLIKKPAAKVVPQSVPVKR